MSGRKTSLMNLKILIEGLESLSADYLQTVLLDYASLARMMIVRHQTEITSVSNQS